MLQRQVHPLSNAVPKLVATIDGAIPFKLEEIPTLSAATPNHGSVIVVWLTPIPIGGSFCVGHHSLNPDLICLESPIDQDCGRFIAKTLQLSVRRRLVPGIWLSSHASASKGDAIAVSAPGMGREIDRVIVQTMHPSITTNDGVIVTWPDPVISGRGPMQVQGWDQPPNDS